LRNTTGFVDEGFNLPDLAFAEPEVTRTLDPFNLAGVASAHDRAGDCRMTESPSDCDLSRSAAMPLANRTEKFG
jgi:hypothetical protein